VSTADGKTEVAEHGRLTNDAGHEVQTDRTTSIALGEAGDVKEVKEARRTHTEGEIDGTKHVTDHATSVSVARDDERHIKAEGAVSQSDATDVHASKKSARFGVDTSQQGVNMLAGQVVSERALGPVED
jgi:hypothetical protein